ncbi:MAG: GHKL domain-containing protein [Cyanobacteria bacterium SBLK]|nr:GHKL domain-containing protein [Cyanobacteria bacterium SBLK]
MNQDRSLFQRSRLQLALWYAGVMGIILGISGFGIDRATIQSNQTAMEREIESIAGTLHDSVEPLLPVGQTPTALLQQIFPDLCLPEQPCNKTPTLIERHTLGISDRSTYYIRLFDRQGQLLAFSPNQPPSLSETFNPAPWQTFQTEKGTRYRQFTTILHSADTHSRDDSWGYLQIGRNLSAFDAEIVRIRWILAIGYPLTLLLVLFSSWWLSKFAMQPIDRAYRQQQQFTANVAHELRSPLASLLATVEAILRMPRENPQQVRTMLQTVERQGRRLSHTIADLLFLTHLEQNPLPEPFQPCCLNDLVSDLTEEFLELADRAEITLTCQIPDREIYVSGNESQLYRLVSNLMDNALQYTPRGGKVEVSLTVRDRHACITVKDTGIGIVSEEQERIFDRFYRVDSDRSRKTGGTGLGLAIVRAIAEGHSAHLALQSKPSQGSSFTIDFPCIIHSPS